MRGGALRNVCTIQATTEVSFNEQYNEPVTTWTAWRDDVFCEVSTRRGAEFFDAATRQRYSQTVHRFRVRYSDVEGISAAMRVLFEGQVYEIKALLPDDQRRADVVIEATLQDGSVQPNLSGA